MESDEPCIGLKFSRDNKENDGRLFPDLPLYCEGANRPLFRGVIHFICTFLLPFGLIEMIVVSNGCMTNVIASTIYISSNIFCYGFSSAFHLFRWSAKVEIFIQKLDHCGIALLSTGTIVPVSLLLLPTQLGLLLLGSTFCSCIWTCYYIFQNKPSVWRQALTAGMLVLFVPFLYPIMNAIEFTCMISTMMIQIVGLVIFVNECPDCHKNIFGYHEVFHVFVSLAGLCVYICNWSVVKRMNACVEFNFEDKLS